MNRCHSGKELHLYLHALLSLYFPSVSAHCCFAHTFTLESRCRQTASLGGRVPPLDLAFTRQTVPNTLFKWSVLIFLQIYGVGSNANAPRVPRRGLMLGLVQFAPLQQTANMYFCARSVGTGATRVLSGSVGVWKQDFRNV